MTRGWRRGFYGTHDDVLQFPNGNQGRFADVSVLYYHGINVSDVNVRCVNVRCTVMANGTKWAIDVVVFGLFGDCCLPSPEVGLSRANKTKFEKVLRGNTKSL
jgi:hypothetical protein